MYMATTSSLAPTFIKGGSSPLWSASVLHARMALSRRFIRQEAGGMGLEKEGIRLYEVWQHSYLPALSTVPLNVRSLDLR